MKRTKPAWIFCMLVCCLVWFTACGPSSLNMIDGVIGDDSTEVPDTDISDNQVDTDIDILNDDTEANVITVDQCYSLKELPCDNPSAYEDPACYISTIKKNIEDAKVNIQTFYVAPSLSAYQDSTGSSTCPWDLVHGMCQWGNDANDGLSRSTALATFYQALYAMYEYQNKAEDKDIYFVLKIVGGDFYYREPIIISARAGLLGKTYLGPRLFKNGQPVKKNNQGDYITWDLTEKDNTVYNNLKAPTDLVVANITVEPYDDKPVTLDGGCRFEYQKMSDGSLLNSDSPDFIWGYSYLNRICELDLCTQAELDAGNQIIEDYGLVKSSSVLDTNLLYGFCNSRGMVNIIKGDNIEVRGINVQNAPYTGIQVQSWSDKVLLADNKIQNTSSSGIMVFYNKNILLEHNTVNSAVASGLHENVSIVYTDGFAMYDNVVHDGYHDEKLAMAYTKDGYIGHNEIFGTGLTGVYVGSGSEGIRVDGNRIHDLSQNTCLLIESENGDPIKDIIMENNLCYNNKAGFGIAITQYNCAKNQTGTEVALFSCEYDEDMDYDNFIIVNNTIYQSGLNTTMGYGLKVDAGSAKNIVVANNIFSNNTTAQIAPNSTHMLESDGTLKDSALVLDNNLLYCNGDVDSNDDGYSDCLNVSDRWYLGELEGYSSLGPGLFSNPLFIDPASADFSLQAHSPAIDAASSDQYIPTYDQDCHVRQKDKADIGAFEYISE